MKSVWKGSISFGLVNIPVKLYSAVNPQILGFRLLCGKCNTPLHYKRYCRKCKKEIAWENVVKGLEISKNKFFVLTKEKIESLKPEKLDTIDIVQFVDRGMIDPLYIDKNYYVVPTKTKEKAYYLFREVLETTAKVAIGRFIMREKQYTAAIESYKNGMLLSTLNYMYEIRDINQIPELKGKVKLNREEIKLAKQLINKFYEKKFNMAEFKDTFAQKLKELIKKRMRGEKVIVKVKKPKKKEETLMKALKASIK